MNELGGVKLNVKSKLLVFLIISSILFINITAVAAVDNRTDAIAQEDRVLTQNNVLSSNNSKSFNDLYDDIEKSGSVFNMDSHYVCDNNESSKTLNVSNLVINGNGHVINGSDKSSGLSFKYLPKGNGDTRANITINNLTLTNINGSAIYARTCKITLNNVIIVNSNYLNIHSNENPGFLELFDCEAILNHCTFKTSFNSSCIGADSSDINMNNSLFQGNNGLFSAIKHNRGSLKIENSYFNNFTSAYGGIINYKGDLLSIKNSKFLNSVATVTGGAIVAKYFAKFDSESIPDALLVENSIFSNVSSLHNGGAIYIDLDSGSGGIPQILNIVRSNFTDCTSGFGGAIADLGGTLNINSSKFINNFATHIGGAIYTSWAKVNMFNSTLLNNSAKLNAGALYFDNGTLRINNSNLTGNKVISSDALNIIYANDVDAYLTNSIFNNSGVIYANFAGDSKLENNNSTDLFLMNNTDFIVSVENKGIKLNFTNNSIVVDKLPSEFDLRDWGWASPLKFQGDNFACWAFATAGAIECALLKSTGILYNLSENNIQNLQLKYYSEGDNRNNVTGFAYSGLGYALSWYGIITAQDDSYDERGMISDVVETENRIHLQDAMFIYGGKNNTVELIKQAIMKYGGVSIQFKPSNFNYNYHNITEKPTHFVALIGWNDTIPAEKFKEDGIMPKGPGGFIVKDSEGLSIGDNGYDYISYYDKSFLASDPLAIVPQAAAVVYIFENNIDYHVNYQTDLTGLVGFDGNYTYYSNEFTSEYDELIGAVGTYFNDSGINYSFDVYINGKLVHTQNGLSEFPGFKTIILNKYLPVKAGDKFKVVFKNNTLPYQAYSRQHYISGMSMVSADGSSWRDITFENKTVCLKIYTVKDDSKIINNRNISVDYGGDQYFTVEVTAADGHEVGEGAVANFTINGKTTSAVTDADGIAKFEITDIPGTYEVTTSYNGQTYKNSVEVNLNPSTCKITQNKDIKVDYDGGKYFSVRIVSQDDKVAASGVSVKFTTNGKTTTVQTDADGIAKIKITDIPKKYTMTTTFNGKSVKNTVTVKQVLKAKKVTVKKTAKKLTLKATLKINGKLQKGKVITFKFNGKTYKVKTNKKGVAQKTLNKKIIKKLKKGKKYTVKVTYKKDTVKTTVKVK